MRKRKKCTPNELTTPCEISSAAYMPMVFPGVGAYVVPTVAVTDTRFASPKVIPVVTATCPRKLNLPLPPPAISF